MNFVNPIALIGLVAAAIPLILHLLNLRKLKIIEFSSLRFLKELQKTKIRRIKLKQLILLILRTLAIIFIVLAIARPTIEGTIPGFSSYSKISAVVILDNSFSMDLSDESGNRFNRARMAVKSIIDELKDGDEAAIIPMTGNSILKKPEFTKNIELLRTDLSNIKISNRKGDIERTLRLAATLSEKATNINREIFIISDAQNNIFLNDFQDSSQILKPDIPIYFIKIGSELNNGITNLSVDSINIISRIFQYDKLVETETIINNGSNKNIKDLVVNLFFDSIRVAQRNLDIQANQSKIIDISALPQRYGLVKAKIRIENDALNYDNERYFGFFIPDKPKVALIGNNDDIEYLLLALNHKDIENSPAKIEIYSPKQIPGINFSDYEIVIFAGGPYLSGDLRKAEQYVKNGGSLLIFADEQTDENIFRNGIKSLEFGSLKEVNYPDDQTGSFTSVDKIHPLFEGVFKGTTDNQAVVESAKISKALVNTDGLPLIKMTSGNFLTESRPGDGKAIYCAVKANDTWSNFPMTGLYPIILYRSIVYLSLSEGLGIFTVAGEPVTLSLPKKYSSEGTFKIVDPNGNEQYQKAVVFPSGAVLSLQELNFSGVYSIYSINDKLIGIISVNPCASESRLDNADEKYIKEYLQSYSSGKSNINIIENSKNIDKNIKRLRAGTELWQLSIILALICLIAEMFIFRTKKTEIE
jgi:hypothetical protein